MSEPTGGAGLLTLAEIFEAKSEIVKTLEERKKGASLPTRILWVLTKSTIKRELDRVLGTSVDEMLEDVFRSESEEGSRITFEGIKKLLKKAKRARKELDRYQKATPQQPAEFRLDIKQTITLRLKQTVRVNAWRQTFTEIEFDVRIVLAFKGASIGVAQRNLHSLSLGSCNIGGSTLECAVRLQGSDPEGGAPILKVRPPDLKKRLGRIDFTPAIPIPFMDRRTGPRRIGEDRRVKVVEVKREQRAAARRTTERRGAADRRQIDRRGSDRREGTEQRVTADRRTGSA